MTIERSDIESVKTDIPYHIVVKVRGISKPFTIDLMNWVLTQPGLQSPPIFASGYASNGGIE
jgi:hypothetical protein